MGLHSSAWLSIANRLCISGSNLHINLFPAYFVRVIPIPSAHEVSSSCYRWRTDVVRQLSSYRHTGC